MKEYRWQICEVHGKKLLEVAEGSASNKEDAEKELNHYALQYSQDCPIKIWRSWE